MWKTLKTMTNARLPSPTFYMIVQTQSENVEYFNCLGIVTTNDARCRRESKPRIFMGKEAFDKRQNLFTSILDLNLRKKLVKCYI
jgi:hypothetical protein